MKEFIIVTTGGFRFSVTAKSYRHSQGVIEFRVDEKTVAEFASSAVVAIVDKENYGSISKVG